MSNSENSQGKSTELHRVLGRRWEEYGDQSLEPTILPAPGLTMGQAGPVPGWDGELHTEESCTAGMERGLPELHLPIVPHPDSQMGGRGVGSTNHQVLALPGCVQLPGDKDMDYVSSPVIQVHL